jgi:photosystem II stability/assembly factor-like uncharacterized protein
MKSLLLLVFSLGIGVHNVFPQWVQTDGPYGNSNALTVFEHDSKYFASTYLSGFFSEPSVEDPWTLNSDLYFQTYTIKGDSLFADAHYFATGLSRDKGILLFDLDNPEASPVTINSTITAQALDHTDSCLFGGNETMGFFKLSFDGTVLEFYNDGLPKIPGGTGYITIVTAIELSGDYFFCGTNQGMFRCDPLLNPWIEINNGLAIGRVTLVEEFLDTLFTAIESNLYYSSDNGNNWSLVYSAPSKITSFQKNDSQLFVSTSNNGVYQSLDNGLNWSSMNSGLSDLSVNFIASLDDAVFCGTTTNGVFYYQSGNWSEDNQGMISSMIRSIAVTGEKVIANDEENVFRLEAGGNWSDITPQVNYDLFASVNSMTDTVFLSVEYDTTSWPYDLPFILYSADQGINWQNLLNPVPFAGDDPYNIYTDNGKLYAYENEFMYYTNDLGLNWTDMSLPPQFCNYFYDYIVCNSLPFAITCGASQIVRFDNSSTWILSDAGIPPDKTPISLAFCNNLLITYVTGHEVYASFDNGHTWTFASNELVVNWGFRDFDSYGENLFVSTDMGIFVTNDYGQNWFDCNDGLINLNTSSVKVMNDTLYAGTYGNGIWKRAIDDLHVSISEPQNSAQDLRIYPNPASGYIFIQIPTNENFEFQIFDNAGRTVLEKEGQKDEKIYFGNLQSGTYFVQVKTKETLLTQKLVISK